MEKKAQKNRTDSRTSSQVSGVLRLSFDQQMMTGTNPGYYPTG